MTQANRIKNLEKVIKLLTEQIELKDQLAKRVEGYSHTFTIPKTPETFEGLHIPHVCEEPKLEVGKWYIIKRIEYDSKYVPALIYLKDKSISNYGFNHAGDWTVSYGDTGSWDNTEDIYTPATDKEISEALIKEAKKRGLKKGIKINQEPAYGCGNIHTIPANNFYYNCDTQNLSIGGIGIYNKGKWAEIIEESVPTIWGNEMKIDSCGVVKFGCVQSNKRRIRNLHSAIKEFNEGSSKIKSFNIKSNDTGYEVSTDQLKELVDYLSSFKFDYFTSL